MYKLSSFCVFSLVLGIGRFWVYFYNFTIILGVKWYLIVILFHISQMMNDVEYLFICLFTVCNCLFKLYPICLLDSFLIFEYWGNSIFWIPVLQKSFVHMWFENIFSELVACVCILSAASFAEQKFLILMKSDLSKFSFHVSCFWYCL